jgi:hypothetical protein
MAGPISLFYFVSFLDGNALHERASPNVHYHRISCAFSASEDYVKCRGSLLQCCLPRIDLQRIKMGLLRICKL